jgi:hypothetical protein
MAGRRPTGSTAAPVAAPAVAAPVAAPVAALAVAAAQTALSGHIRALLGEAAPGGIENETLMKELISLYDSVHDFGTYGLPYDYVRKLDGGGFYTSKRTTFNHLRNTYSTLRGRPNVSYYGSQLRCSDTNFYLKASITKNALEDSFLEAATAYYTALRGVPLKKDHRAVTNETFNIFRTPDKSAVVFSVDTQKRLNEAINRLVTSGVPNKFFFVYDMEKVCDPAPHQFAESGVLQLLTESPGQTRTYDEGAGIIGVTSAKLSGFNPAGKKATIEIQLEGEDAAAAGNTIEMNKGGAHKNNITLLQKLLNAQFAAYTSTDGNISKDPNSGDEGNGFYPGISGYTDIVGDTLKTHVFDLRRKFAQKRLGDQLQVLSCKNQITYTRDGNYTVKNAVFVSIDKMAIAFAIMNGVNCIYSNGENLIFYVGDAKCEMKTAAGALVGGGASIPRPIKQKGGAADPYLLNLLTSGEDPQFILDLFMYSAAGGAGAADGAAGGVPEWKTFVTRIDNKIEDNFEFFVDGANAYATLLRTGARKSERIVGNIRKHLPKLVAGARVEDPAVPVYFVDITTAYPTHYFYQKVTKVGGNWVLSKGKHYFGERSLDNPTGDEAKKTISIGALTVLLNSLYEAGEYQEGGDRDTAVKHKILHALAVHDIMVLADPEQKHISHDPYYTHGDGVLFFKPTYYELYGLIHTLLERKDAHEFTLAMTYLLINPNKSQFISSIKLIMGSIFEYISYPIEKIVAQLPTLRAEDIGVCETIFASAERLSTFYANGLGNKDPNALFDFCMKYDVTPLSFYNAYNASPKAPAKPSQTLVSAAKRNLYNLRNTRKKLQVRATPVLNGVARRRRTRRHRR